MKAVYYLSHRVAKVMVRQRSGKIINITPALSFTADKMCPAYVAAKHAVIGITRTFANELGKYNIRLTPLRRVFCDRCQQEISSNKEFYDKITGRIPAGRWEKPLI